MKEKKLSTFAEIVENELPLGYYIIQGVICILIPLLKFWKIQFQIAEPYSISKINK
jgi:hypothetical protein